MFKISNQNSDAWIVEKSEDTCAMLEKQHINENKDHSLEDLIIYRFVRC